MRRFCQLYEALDGTTRTNAKVEAMVRYLEAAPAEDAAWAVFFLTGQRLKRLISGRTLRAWAQQRTGLPEWLVDEAHAAVGDSAETAALLLPCANDAADASAPEPLPLHRWLEERILPLQGQPADRQYAEVCGWWQELPRGELFVLNKLLTGAFRVGVSKLLVVRALAEVAGLPRATIAHRLMGRPQPSPAWYRGLLSRREHRRSRAALSVLPRLAARGRPREPGPARRLARRVEVGRHSRPADAPRRRDLPVVARRGADHRTLPRADPGGGTAAGWRRAGRRGAGLGRRPCCRSPCCSAGSAAIA